MAASNLMPSLIMCIDSLSVLETILCVLLLRQMWLFGLIRVYRLFSALVLLQALLIFVFLLVHKGTNLAALLYRLSTPPAWILSILVIYELYARLLHDYPGIVTAGRWMLSAATVIAVVVSLLSSPIDWNVAIHKFPITYYYSYVQRAISTTQMLFMLAMTVFLRWFPIRLSRNIHVHTAILFLYCLVKFSISLLYNFSDASFTDAINLVDLIGSCLCFAGWILQFGPNGTDAPANQIKVDSEQEARILLKLRAINDTLVGAGKR